MRLLILGGGAREHALAWKLAQNATVDKMFAVPGNPGIAELAETLDADPADAETIANLAEDLGIDLTVVGPEAPLVAGLVDELSERGLAAFGPTAAAARIEGSKSWAKGICERAGAPHSRARAFTDPAGANAYLDELGDPPYVVKADGLAAGKGVTVAASRREAEAAIADSLVHGAFGASGSTVVIEEFLEGDELSVFCLTDGRTVLPLAEARDFKRIGDGDEGPNTGGMGAYSPVADRPADAVERAVREIVEPVVRQMESEGARYHGLLYAGLMLTTSGPKVIEFNCRFGDPETQAVLPRLETDLAELLLACVEGNLAPYVPRWSPRTAVTVCLASQGYPGSYETGKEIGGLGDLGDAVVFHAGTARRDDGALVTAGGRVLAVTGLGDDVGAACDSAYAAADRITFEGKYHRTDIASRARGGTQ